ncbi:MAG: hypothetical protein HY901_17475 [Deltaproteobacteria bacterium]|nr:hypothetical protein [Deltaproteobacteria bacterium]
MIPLRLIAELDVSAASGLVRDGRHLFVIADDEHFLDAYHLATGRRAARISLGIPGDLPSEHHSRKRLKPDLESLTMLPGGQLLALGSGSADNRCTGFLLEPPLASPSSSKPRAVELRPLYQSLRERFPELNLEGGAVGGPWLRLLQRGNGAAGANAVIDLDLAGVLAALRAGRALTPDLVQQVHPVALGELDGVPLGFTDASPLDPGEPRIAFVAAAEDTDDPYEDGACAGSVLGVLDARGQVEWSDRLEGRHKVEGLVISPANERAWLVADPDDRARRAPLFQAGPLLLP